MFSAEKCYASAVSFFWRLPRMKGIVRGEKQAQPAGGVISGNRKVSTDFKRERTGVKKWCFSFLGVILPLLLLAGCGRGVTSVPDRLVLDAHASGNNQAGIQGTTLPKPLHVVAEGAQEPGLLGGKGSRRAARGVEVLFKVIEPVNGAVFEENNAQEIRKITDAAGSAMATVRLGNTCGDVIINASSPEYPDIRPVPFRVISGAERIGEDLESSTGGTVERFGVRLRDADGSPAEGVKVFFRVEGDGHGSKVGAECKRTDDKGEAVTSWTLGDKVQRYFASVEVLDNRRSVAPDYRFHVRTLEFEAMATDKKQMLIVLLGGLAVFIFGMKLMSEGLQKVADRRLRKVLNFMTQNRFMAVFAGLLITAMIQSSSATTVMAVGFVNAGLMSLAQSVGVIYGANIGTTITAQIIAFKLDELAYPAIAAGLALMMFSKRPQVRSAGQAILGFGLLFLGMKTMSGILKPLRYSPEFVSWFQIFDCTPEGGRGMVQPLPALMCIVIGTVMTCVIQSSSATVGLVMALASQGLISFYTAVPLILGDNIGTTITANLAAIGANRNARRTAIAHTLFNVFGTIYMYILLFLPFWKGQPVYLGFINAITAGEVFTAHPENLLRHVANAHSAFNIFNCILFLPFTQLMAKICMKIIPLTDEDRDSVLQYLEPKLLQTPSIALQQAVREVTYMVRKGEKSTYESIEVLTEGKTALIPAILEREDVIDRLQHEIAEYLVQISRRTLTNEEARLMPALLHAVNDAERLGDHAEETLEIHHLLQEYNLKLPPAEIEEMRDIRDKLQKQFANVIAVLEGKDSGVFDAVKTLEKEIKSAIRDYTDAHVRRLDDDACDVQAGVMYLDALTHLERVSQHLLNIAERGVEMAKVINA
jgi:phosphate:Na+ symporter